MASAGTRAVSAQFGARIAAVRRARCMSRRELADRSDSHEAHLWKIEAGRTRTITLELIARLASTLEVGVDLLLSGKADAMLASGKGPLLDRNVIDSTYTPDGWSCWLIEVASGPVVLSYEVTSVDLVGHVRAYLTYRELVEAREAFTAMLAGL